MARTRGNRARLSGKLIVARSFAEADAQDRCECSRITPWRRLEVVELLRQLNHADYDPDTGSLR